MARKPKTVHFWRGDLPHWQVEDGRYFVTIHLYGAIPWVGQKRIRDISQQLQTADPNDEDAALRTSRLIFKEMELWLDRTLGVRHFEDERVAQMVMEAIMYRSDQRRWQVFEFVVMPTHIHLFFELGEDQSLKWVLEDFKRWTGHEAAKLIDVARERFWQKEWFDHWSESDEEDENTVEYIRRNPEKAGLVRRHLDWPYGSWGLAKRD